MFQGLGKLPFYKILLVVLLLLLKVSIVIFIPLLYKMGLDKFVKFHYFDWYVYLSFFIMLGVFWVCSIYIQKILQKSSQEIFINLRNNLFRTIAYLSPSLYKPQAIATEVEQLFNAKITSLEQAVSQTFPDLLYFILQATGSLIFMYVFNWELALIFTLALPVIVYIPKKNVNVIKKYERYYKRDNSRLGEIARKVVLYVEIINLFELYRYWKTRFDKWVAKAVYVNKKMSHSINRNSTLTFVLANCLAGILVMLTAWLILKGRLTIGASLGFIFLFANVSAAGNGITRLLPSFISTLNNAKSISDFIKKNPIRPQLANLLKIDKIADIKFENVSLMLNKEIILNNINFHIKLNGAYAFVGSSGSGKTTILKLIMGLYPPTNGTIYINDVDMKLIDIRSIRHQIAAVLQENYLFEESVYTNILFGNLQADNHKIVSAAKDANIHNDILALSNQYNTRLGEGMIKLSAGQRKRIAIARALVKDFSVFITDEVTSPLDPKNEEIIDHHLAVVTKGKILISATHRLSAITKVDKIFFLSNHTVEEQGSHSELLAKRGLYYQLWNKQSFVKIKETYDLDINIEYFRKILLFNNFPDDMLHSLKNYFSVEEIEKDVEVVRAGEIGNKFYMIIRGRVEVIRQGSDKKIVLEEGDYFGEIALIKNFKRTATIKTVTDCQFLVLSQAEFNLIIKSNSELYQKVLAEAERRMQSNSPGELDDSGEK